MSRSDEPTPLTNFQLEVAAMFFQLPGSGGFLLAGGAALAAHHLTTRPTQDLDFFTSPGRGDIPAARDQLIAAAHARGWKPQVITDQTTFCRLQITGTDELAGRHSPGCHTRTRADCQHRRTDAQPQRTGRT